jgi:hypothetical protein
MLRDLLAIRQKQIPDSWLTFNTQSLLGGALLGQKKYVEAEPLLVKGYAGLKTREKTIPQHGWRGCSSPPTPVTNSSRQRG